MIVENENADDSYHMEDHTKKFLPHAESGKEKNPKFAGLSKEEVLAYASDPTWVKLRWMLFIVFWVIWFALLGSAVAVVIITPSCPERPKMNWWQRETVYQVDVAKFKDSNGDGLGDLVGLLNKVNYFKDLGIQSLCLKDNILDKNSPKELKSEYKLNLTPRVLTKALGIHDITVILDVPFSVLDKDSSDKTSVLEHWLHSLDGVRVIDVPENTDPNVLKKWTDLRDKVSKDTFEEKFIAFYPYESANTNGNATVPSTAFKTLFKSNVFLDAQSKTNFLSSLQSKYENFDKKIWPSFLTSENENTRISELFNDKSQLKLAHGLSLMLKGTPFVLFGDELEFSNEDKYMRWDSSINCGFSTNKSINIEQNCEHSVQDSFSHGAGQNLVRMYKQLTQLRKEPSFNWGDVKFSEDKVDENILSFVREAEGFDGYLVASNVDQKAGSVDFSRLHNIPKNATVSYFYSDNEMSANEFRVGWEVSTGRILLKPGELLIVKFDKRF